MTRKDFIRFISTNVPHVGKRTAALLYEGGINSIDALENCTLENITTLGVNRYRAVAIKAFSDARLRLYRYTKGFDSFWDPGDILWIAFVGASIIFTTLIPVFDLTKVPIYFQLVLSALILFLSGLYWCFVLIHKPRTKLLLFATGVCFFMIIVHRITLSFLGVNLRGRHEIFVFGAYLVLLVTYAHFSIFKYRNILNVRNETVEVLTNGVVGLSALWLLKLISSLFAFIHEPIQLSSLEIATILFGIVASVFFLLIGHAIAERRHFPSRQTLLGLYGVVFIFLTLWGIDSFIAGFDLSSLISQICADFLLVIIPVVCLWCYIIYPRKFFPRLGRAFLTINIVMSGAIMLSELGLLTWLLSVSVEGRVWIWIDRVGNILAILTFISFTGGLGWVFRRLITFQGKPSSMASLSEVREAAEEKLSWSDVSDVDRHDDYFDVSNLCFQFGYFDLGIEYLHRALDERKWPDYGKGVLNYQLACGHALAGRRDQALDYLKKSLFLFPRFKKYVARDEMLSSIANDIEGL